MFLFSIGRLKLHLKKAESGERNSLHVGKTRLRPIYINFEYIQNVESLRTFI